MLPRLEKNVTVPGRKGNFAVGVTVSVHRIHFVIMSNWSRFQVIILVFLGLFVVVRLFSDSPVPRGSIMLSDLDVREIRQQAFQVSGPLRVVIDAVGSIDERQGAAGLAAYAWITRGNTGEVVWSMNASNTIQDGSIAYVDGEELELDSGTYILNYASYGQLQRRSDTSFRKDRRKWRVTVYSPNDKGALRPITRPLKANSQTRVFEAVSLEAEERREFFFEIQRPAEFEISAIGQLGSQDEVQPVDYSRIENAVTGSVVWQLTRDNTQWAGGVQENRVFQGRRTLNPGVYRAVAVTNGRHHFGNWIGNPPFDPQGWGLHISTSDTETVSTFDPWMQRDPIIQFTEVGDDEEHVKFFAVEDTTAVVLYALGEITGPDNGYDYAWLDKQDGSTGESGTRWKMTYEGSVHAGGARKNRKEVKFLRLEPGVYGLHYESDGSHSYDHWNSSEPDYPERWGVALFPVQKQSPGATIRLIVEE